MKLIAVEPITQWLPAGAKFEIPDDDAASAHALIESGLARKDLDAEGELTPAATAEPAAAVRRSYRRRDLKAED